MLATLLAPTLGLTAPPLQLRSHVAPRCRLSMKGTPRVPFKYPGMQEPVWVDVYNRMYRERIMFMKQYIDDNFANQMIAVLLYLESEDANAGVQMYCNSFGGESKAGLAIYDTMRIMPFEIQTINLGICAQTAAFVVAGGSPGKRFALPNSRFAMMNPRIDPIYDNEGNPQVRIMQATEMKLEVEEVMRDKKRMLEGFSKFSGRSTELLRMDFSRDFYLSATEAVQYGLVDEVVGSKKPAKDDSLKLADVKLGSFVSKDEQKLVAAPPEEAPADGAADGPQAA